MSFTKMHFKRIKISDSVPKNKNYGMYGILRCHLYESLSFATLALGSRNSGGGDPNSSLSRSSELSCCSKAFHRKNTDLIRDPAPQGTILWRNFTRVLSCVEDPDWIRIQCGPWIRIRIRNPDPDPDPGGQKGPTKIKKTLINFIVLRAGCSLLRAEGFP